MPYLSYSYLSCSSLRHHYLFLCSTIMARSTYYDLTDTMYGQPIYYTFWYVNKYVVTKNSLCKFNMLSVPWTALSEGNKNIPFVWRKMLYWARNASSLFQSVSSMHLATNKHVVTSATCGCSWSIAIYIGCGYSKSHKSLHLHTGQLLKEA